jgi:hypothetical protein
LELLQSGPVPINPDAELTCQMIGPAADLDEVRPTLRPRLLSIRARERAEEGRIAGGLRVYVSQRELSGFFSRQP